MAVLLPIGVFGAVNAPGREITIERIDYSFSPYIVAVGAIPVKLGALVRVGLPADVEKLIKEVSGQYGVNSRLVTEIVTRESRGNHTVCNKEFGCSGGKGLVQVIPKTEATCEKHFNREMDMAVAEDNLECGVWLLTKSGVCSGIGNWDDFSWKRGEDKVWGSGPYKLLDFGYTCQ